MCSVISGGLWMGSSMPSSTSEAVGLNSRFHSHNYKHACMEQDQCTYGIREKIMKGISLEDLDIHCVTENDNLIIPELGTALEEVLHIHDECLNDSNLTLNQHEICNDSEMQSFSVNTHMLNGLCKCEMMSRSEMLQLHPLDIDVGERLSSPVVHIWSSSKPPVSKLVSAMKGSRSHEGMLPKMKLRVKWSPDVYDPPPTSESHTVKGHRYRPKATKKDYYKHKHAKGKSSRGSGGDRKHAYKRNASNLIDPQNLVAITS
ncbi:uncharacterized protein LOC103719741 isoform X2 [Phoenix dactylifera]|uniref:Uncharacterized protein LOC103719741 isoform X2 n=1 Tax=Phoenix dactylifera TaxID=42345 RepID=A0A8B9APE5_PHODC|nr:uncharacterized protein LOC103719741 isoform X2 [Phoenix dactylifera]